MYHAIHRYPARLDAMLLALTRRYLAAMPVRCWHWHHAVHDVSPEHVCSSEFERPSRLQQQLQPCVATLRAHACLAPVQPQRSHCCHHTHFQLPQEEEQPSSRAGLARAVVLRYGHLLRQHWASFQRGVSDFNVLQVCNGANGATFRPLVDFACKV